MRHPEAFEFIAHPECGTPPGDGRLYRFYHGYPQLYQASEYHRFIVAAEVGIIHQMQNIPHKTFIPVHQITPAPATNART